MSEPSAEPPPETAISVEPLPPTGPRGKVLLSWLALLAIAGGFLAFQSFGKRQMAAAQNLEDTGNYAVLELQARADVGAVEMMRDEKKYNDAEAAKHVTIIDHLNRGSIGQRLRAIMVIGEVGGPAAALKRIDELKKEIENVKKELTPDEARALDIVTRLETDYGDGRPNAPTVTPDERRFIAERFGWFGQLALHPDQSDNAQVRLDALADARRTTTVVTVLVFVLIGLVLLGSFNLFVLTVMGLRGKWKSGLGPAAPHHGVYVETFVLWFGLYLLLLIGGPRVVGDRLSMPVFTCAAMLASLIALAWPVCRGLKWKKVREDVGLTFGRAPLLEPTMGIICYFTAWPLVIFGALTTILLNFLYGPVLRQFFPAPEGPAADPFRHEPGMSHPVVDQIAAGQVHDWLPLIVMAALVAPLMEEIAFRGLLYRHLRDATRAWKFGVILSMVFVSVLFAVVHPQGVFAVPILASLAMGFVIAREWRGTLIPAVIAHGLNNSLILAFLVLCLMR